VTLKETRRAESVNGNVTYINGNRISVNAVLQELYELLEDYSPMWYTERHHNRASAALREPSSSNTAP
jgi:hypothetical protein